MGKDKNFGSQSELALHMKRFEACLQGNVQRRESSALPAETKGLKTEIEVLDTQVSDEILGIATSNRSDFRRPSTFLFAVTPESYLPRRRPLGLRKK